MVEVTGTELPGTVLEINGTEVVSVVTVPGMLLESTVIVVSVLTDVVSISVVAGVVVTVVLMVWVVEVVLVRGISEVEAGGGLV